MQCNTIQYNVLLKEFYFKIMKREFCVHNEFLQVKVKISQTGSIRRKVPCLIIIPWPNMFLWFRAPQPGSDRLGETAHVHSLVRLGVSCGRRPGAMELAVWGQSVGDQGMKPCLCCVCGGRGGNWSNPGQSFQKWTSLGCFKIFVSMVRLWTSWS